ncbi:hypothetical protein ACO0OL_004134 [Hanseniaspora opuntiae]
MNVETKNPFTDITNRLYSKDSNKKQPGKYFDTLSKYTRSVNQQSERTKNTLKFIAISREPSLVQSSNHTNTKEQDVQNDNMNTDEETLTAEKNDVLFTSEQSKDYVLNKKTLDNMRIPSINSLPSFSFSYSFVSSSESKDKNVISKEKVLTFKNKLREARRKFVMKEMLLRAENMDKHSQLSITAAESLLNLTRK